MNSLLKLQPPVVIDAADAKEIESLKRLVSIPASRLADAKRTAEASNIDADDVPRHSLALVPSAPTTLTRRDRATKVSRCDMQSAFTSSSINENVLTRSTISPHLVAAMPAVEKAARIEESNSKGSLAYPGGAVLPALMRKQCDVESILYTLLPPKSSFCKESGKTTMQFVSLEPTLRTEVAELHERLLQQLHERRARNSGVCPIRREIYAELFDELIRQVTLEEPTRGILLLRVRDELHQTLAAHRSLLERSMHFSSRQLNGTAGAPDALKQRIKELEETRYELLARQKAAKVRVDELLFAIEQENTARAKERQEELGYYRRANRQLAQRIKLETERSNAHGVTLCTSLIGEECAQVVASPTP